MDSLCEGKQFIFYGGSEMADIKKENPNDFEIRECMSELRDRLHLLTHTTTRLIKDETVPSDNTVCGVLHAFGDCEKVIDRVEAMAGGKV